MCEIAVYNPDELDTNDAFDLAFDMFQSNNDGLGALAVYRHEDRFEYEPFAQANPHWGDFFSFLREQAGSAWRIILHARLSTTGEDNDQNTHPLEVGEGSNFDWVIHNGVVSNHQNIKSQAKQAGHTYATGVDSESIAHCVQEIPEDTDDIDDRGEYSLQGRLNYILCNEDGIFVRNSGKYEWSEDFTMTRCRRKTSFGGDSNIKWMILRPFDEVHTVQDKDKFQSGSTGGYYSGAGNRGSYSGKSTTQLSFGEGAGAFFDEDGELLAYDEYKDQYGSDENPVLVSESELGNVMSPDERVPDAATGMYVDHEGDNIEWWNLNQEHGTIEVDEVVSEDPEACLLSEGEDDLRENEEAVGNGQGNGKSGSDSATVSAEDYDDEELQIWNGHFG